MIKKALLFLLVMGCLVSAAASGRVSARLILDGAISFAFIPIIQIAAFALVYRLSARRSNADQFPPFVLAADRFFAGDTPWLLWLVLVAAILGIAPPRVSGGWLLTIATTAIVPAIAVARVDFRFFRQVMGASAREATRRLVLHRAVGWILAIAYFFGIALWSEQLPELAKALRL